MDLPGVLDDEDDRRLLARLDRILLDLQPDLEAAGILSPDTVGPRLPGLPAKGIDGAGGAGEKDEDQE